MGGDRTCLREWTEFNREKKKKKKRRKQQQQTSKLLLQVCSKNKRRSLLKSEDVMTMSLQVESINEEKEIIEHNGNYGVESTIIKMENLLEGLNSKFELAEEIIYRFEYRVIEVMQSEEDREK